MFQIGDYIIYGNKGVCQVDNVGVLNSTDIPKDKIYYTLITYFTKGSKIYTPVDNDKVLMRPVITKDEALKLIDDIKNIDSLWINDDKRREIEYKEALRKCDCRELVKIIKTIYLREQERLNDGKKLSSIDNKYFSIAEEYFYGELAIALGMDIEAVKEYVISKVKQADVE